MIRALRTTLIGGVLFLIPLAFLAVGLAKAWQIALAVAAPIQGLLPFGPAGAVALADLIAIVLLVGLCFLAGLAARVAPLAAYRNRLDGMLIGLLPGYSLVRSAVSGAISARDEIDTLIPVTAAFDDHAAIGFEVERNDETVVVFLPGAPGAFSGQTVLMAPDRVTRLDVKPHQVAGLMRVLGRGYLPGKEAAGA
jgi:uncharacterized membrane protein